LCLFPYFYSMYSPTDTDNCWNFVLSIKYDILEPRKLKAPTCSGISSSITVLLLTQYFLERPGF
jgi:hypothetical protein